MKICGLAVLLFFGVSFNALASELEEKVIKICGSGDNQVLMRDLGQAYERLNPGVRVEVPDSIGSSGGIKATANGQCDLGRTARPLNRKEQQYNLIYKMFARSPVVFVVSGNLESVGNLSSEQVVRIYSGKIRSWQDLGGPDGKIYVANREKGDSSRSVLEKHLIDFELIKNPAGKTIYTTPETINVVANNDNTIVYAPLSAAKTESNVRVVAFQGVMPSAEAMAKGKYPLFSEFGLVWRQENSAKVRDFVKFLSTSEAQGIIARSGAAPALPGNQ